MNHEDLLQQAKAFTQDAGYVSVSSLQRKFMIGYQQARQLTDTLIQQGFCEAEFTPEYGYRILNKSDIIMNHAIPQLLDRVSNELKALETARQRYEKQLAPNFSVFDYIYTDEMMLSRIIADLLNPHGTHAQGVAFLSLFLEILNLSDEEDNEWRNIDLEQANVTVQTEKMTSKSRRMDIYIHIQSKEKSYSICIENKPFSLDGGQQLEDYATEINRITPKNWHIVYLSGYGNQPAEYSVKSTILKEWIDSHLFSQINFPDLIVWLKQCLAICQNDKVSYFIKEFQYYVLKTFAGVNDMSEQEMITKLINSNEEYKKAFDVLYHYGSTVIKNDLNDKIYRLGHLIDATQWNESVSKKYYGIKMSNLFSCVYFDFKKLTHSIYIDVYVDQSKYSILISDRQMNSTKIIQLKQMFSDLEYAYHADNNKVILDRSFINEEDPQIIKDFIESLITKIINYQPSDNYLSIR